MKILVTAGPTREAIDPVRFISNRSTGKMGCAIAAVAQQRGHSVQLVLGPSALEPPGNVVVTRVISADDMLSSVLEKIPWCDALVMAAAVADWRPRSVEPHKLKKHDGVLTLNLERTPDILESVRSMKGSRIYIGFAAETRDVTLEATRKLEAKGLDLIVANDVSRSDAGFESDDNVVTFLDADGSVTEFPKLPKSEVGIRLLEWIESKC